MQTNYASEWQGAHWPDAEEITRTLTRSAIHEQAKDGGPILFYDSYQRASYTDTSDNHTMVIGVTGSKKSRCVMAPTIKRCADAGQNIIATCTKGTLYMQCAPWLDQMGYHVHLLDYRNPAASPDTWNPLQLPYAFYCAGEKDIAQELLDDISYSLTHQIASKEGDPFWDNAACSYIAANARALMEVGESNEIHLKSVATMLSAGEQRHEMGTCAKAFFQTFPRESCCAAMASGTIEAGNDTRRSILSVALEHIRPFSSNNALVSMLSHTSFSIDALAEGKKEALFILLPDEKATYHVLASILIKQVYEQLVRIAQMKFSGVLPHRCCVVLDEFANLPCIRDFVSIISAARSRNITMVLAIQSYSQLEARYGDRDARTIFENCSNLMFFYSRNYSFLETLSNLCGEQYRWVLGQKQARPLIAAAELQHLAKGECLIFHDRTPAYICSLPDITEYLPYEEPTLFSPKPAARPPYAIFDIQAYVARKENENDTELSDAFENRRRRRLPHIDDIDFDELFKEMQGEDDEQGSDDVEAEHTDDGENEGDRAVGATTRKQLLEQEQPNNGVAEDDETSTSTDENGDPVFRSDIMRKEDLPCVGDILDAETLQDVYRIDGDEVAVGYLSLIGLEPICCFTGDEDADDIPDLKEWAEPD